MKLGRGNCLCSDGMIRRNENEIYQTHVERLWLHQNNKKNVKTVKKRNSEYQTFEKKLSKCLNPANSKVG